jgi:hypothetical protein
MTIYPNQSFFDENNGKGDRYFRWRGDREKPFNLPDYRELKNEPLQVKH